MSIAYAAIRGAIGGVIEGRLPSTDSLRVVPKGRFRLGGEDGLEDSLLVDRAARAAGADKANPVAALYDVEPPPSTRGVGAHPVGAGVSVEVLSFTVVLTHALPPVENTEGRQAVKWRAVGDHDLIADALMHHGNLLLDEGGNATGIAGGCVREASSTVVRNPGTVAHIYVTARTYTTSVSVERNPGS